MVEDFAPWLGVFETVRIWKGVPLFAREHEAELRRAAEALGLPVEASTLAKNPPPGSGRWRWIVRTSGTETLFTEESPAFAEPVDLSLSAVRVGSQNWDARFKTLSYLTHAQALKESSTGEAVLLNEHREVASAARANLFWRRGERLYTPTPETGCRRGIVRGFVLSQRSVVEGAFPYEDLLEADEIFFTNSMRGIVSARSIDGRALRSSDVAADLRIAYEKAVQSQR